MTQPEYPLWPGLWLNLSWRKSLTLELGEEQEITNDVLLENHKAPSLYFLNFSQFLL